MQYFVLHVECSHTQLNAHVNLHVHVDAHAHVNVHVHAHVNVHVSDKYIIIARLYGKKDIIINLTAVVFQDEQDFAVI